MLWEAGIPLGVVVAPYLARGMRIEVTGENAPSGPTPMARRKNALVGAAAVALTVDRVGHDYADREGKSTVARIAASPNIPGIISDRATLFVAFRSPDPNLTAEMEERIRDAIPGCAAEPNTTVATGPAPG